ncbi:MAG: metallophosphoesterase [Opitutaceae bacterium]|nr:metallophosphoesterase [Opitutaceae bacterium]
MRRVDALVPQENGHQFVLYGDCCSGIPGGPFERNFAHVNGALQQLDPPPDFILFLGDHVDGAGCDEDSLREQWHHWLTKEMAWLDSSRIPIYHLASNHNTFDLVSEAVWRETFPDIPRNGPSGQEGLSYWVRRGDLLLVIVNTSFSGLGGDGHVECAWLDATLSAHADARHKIVAGHHPIFPVNGYDERPGWCIVQERRRRFGRSWSAIGCWRIPVRTSSRLICRNTKASFRSAPAERGQTTVPAASWAKENTIILCRLPWMSMNSGCRRLILKDK